MESCGQETEDDRCEQMRIEQWTHSLVMILKDASEGDVIERTECRNERGWNGLLCPEPKTESRND